MRRAVQWLFVLAVLFVAASPAAAQSDSGTMAKIRDYIDRIGERLTPTEGIYPRIGGLTTGSGLAVGAGYRTQRWLGIPVDFSGVVSTRNYKQIDAKARWAAFAHNHVELWTTFNWHDYPQEDFFGLGLSSALRDRADYGIRGADISAQALFRITRGVRAGVDVGRYAPVVFRGTDKKFPTLQDVFTDRDAPGIDAQPVYLHRSVFVDADFRDKPGNPRRGGHWLVTFGTWDDRTLEQFDFHRLDVEGAHFFPVAPRQVLALHMRMSFANNEPGDRVPFYAFPYVGGNDTIRGFDEFRFREENAFALNAEYRVDVAKHVEVAGFVDGGEVRHNWEDIGLGGLKMAYGGGVRVKSDSSVFARLDIGAGGGEGTLVFLKFGKAF